MSWCLGHLALLGQNQNWILFRPSLLKKELTTEVTGINMFYRGLILDSKIFLAAIMESVMRIMSWTFSFSMASIRPSRMAMSLASTDITFIELICKRWMMELSDQISGSAPRFCPNRKGTLGFNNSSLSPTPFHLYRFKLYNEEGQKMIKLGRSFPKGEQN